MAARAHLLGVWKSKNGHFWHVKKSYDRFLSIEFHVETIDRVFGISSDFIFPEKKWNRFDPESFEDLIKGFKLEKMKGGEIID